VFFAICRGLGLSAILVRIRIPQMQKKISTKGGAREGAGRKPLEEPRKTRSIRATDAQWAAFKSHGGNDWFCALMDSLKKSPKALD